MRQTESLRKKSFMIKKKQKQMEHCLLVRKCCLIKVKENVDEIR